MSTNAERVAKGAAFLDEHDPGWWRDDVNRAISLDELDLRSDETCVLGQRCPFEVLVSYTVRKWNTDDAEDDDRYIAYARELSGLEGSAMIEWAHDRGFALDGAHDAGTAWDHLTYEWIRVITARREVPR